MKLNDIELCQHTLTIILQARKLDELSANGNALALAECLTKIEDSARAAQWRLLRITDSPWVETIQPKTQKRVQVEE